MPSRGFHSCGAVKKKKKGQWQIEGSAEKQSDKMFRKQGLSEKVNLTGYVQSEGKEENLRDSWE